MFAFIKLLFTTTNIVFAAVNTLTPCKEVDKMKSEIT
jgi:hypothetical protein